MTVFRGVMPSVAALCQLKVGCGAGCWDASIQEQAHRSRHHAELKRMYVTATFVT